MKYLKEKGFYRFFIPALFGMTVFVMPLSIDGNLTIPVAVLAHGLLDLIGNHMLMIIWALIALVSNRSSTSRW